VAVNESIAELAREVRDGERVWHVPGFLRPSLEAAPLSESLKPFVAGHSPLILAMGRLTDVGAYKDLYGAEVLVRLLARLRQGDFPHAGLVFALTQASDWDSPNGKALRRLLAEKGVEEHFFVRREPGDLVSLMKHADVMVRPTKTEGDSNAIREALWAELPVVTSDVGARPRGVALYPLGDLDRLEQACADVLGDRGAAVARARSAKPDDNWPRLAAIMKEGLESRRFFRGRPVENGR